MTTKPEEKKAFPPRVWLRLNELSDLCSFDGAEGDVLTIYSPQSIIITGHRKYISEEESDALVRDAVAKAIDSRDQIISDLEAVMELTHGWIDINMGEYTMSRWANAIESIRSRRDARTKEYKAAKAREGKL